MKNSKPKKKNTGLYIISSIALTICAVKFMPKIIDLGSDYLMNKTIN